MAKPMCCEFAVVKDLGWADSPYGGNTYCIDCGAPTGWRLLRVRRAWADGSVEISEETHRAPCRDCERIRADR